MSEAYVPGKARERVCLDAIHAHSSFHMVLVYSIDILKPTLEPSKATSVKIFLLM